MRLEITHFTATEYHLGLLKAKLAKYRSQLLEPSKKSEKGEGFDVLKSGDARVALIGFPSVGKVNENCIVVGGVVIIFFLRRAEYFIVHFNKN